MNKELKSLINLKVTNEALINKLENLEKELKDLKNILNKGVMENSDGTN